MRYNFKEKNIQIGERTKEKITKKLDKLEKLFSADTLATVMVGEERINYIVEVTIPIHRRMLRAEAIEQDLMAAVDKVCDILEAQVKKYKNRMRTRSRQNHAYKDEYESIPVDIDDLEEESAFKIEKNKKFELMPMDAEEAVMQMELLGHNFFIFRNSETDLVNVVYKRKNGTYGLIEPEE
jgi:putative sigma-54 modulation protein